MASEYMDNVKDDNYYAWNPRKDLGHILNLSGIRIICEDEFLESKGEFVLEVTEISKKLIVQNREAYEVLAGYSRLTDGEESALDEADRVALDAERRFSHKEVF